MNAPVGTTPTKILPSAPKGTRNYVIIENTDNVPIYLSIDGESGTLSTTNGLTLAPGSKMVISKDCIGSGASEQPIFAVHGSTGNKNLQVQYGV